jgi:hypothetical protein
LECNLKAIQKLVKRKKSNKRGKKLLGTVAGPLVKLVKRKKGSGGGRKKRKAFYKEMVEEFHRRGCTEEKHMKEIPFGFLIDNWGGGPEIVATVGLLSTINRKLSPIKGPWCVPFGGRCELPRPVRSHLGQKKLVGQ